MVRPAWGELAGDEGDDGVCCDTWIDPVGADPPIGIGWKTAGFAYGDPFCDEDNFWQTYRLPAGTYHYPIYSAPTGTAAVPPGAQYQLHITVGACPDAACCLGDDCIFTDELDCADQGGFWIYGEVSCG